MEDGGGMGATSFDFSDEERRKQIESNFSYHPPTPEQAKLYEYIREEYKKMALILWKYVPDCRERSIALTELEISCMEANAAIARHT